MDNDNDLLKKLGDSQTDIAETMQGDHDPFDDSGRDFFDRYLGYDFDRSNRSAGLSESHLLMSANEQSFQDMVGNSMDRARTSNDPFMMSLNMGNELAQQNQSQPFSFSRHSQTHAQHTQSFNQAMDNNNSWLESGSGGGQSSQQGDMLDAAPLNVSLGFGADTTGSTSSGNIQSMLLRRKGSNAQLHGSKFNAARKVGLTSSKLKSAKSEGMLARALKAKYNSGNNLTNMYNMNAAEASAVVNAKFPRASMSAVRAASGGEMMAGFSPAGFNGDGPAAEEREGFGARNATWGAVSSRKPGASLFADLISSPNSEGAQGLTSTDSMNSLLRQQKATGGGSRTSMQELLRLSKKQSKTQSALRQSSAQSLLRQTSSQSVRGSNQNVDVSSLLPPHHAMMGLTISGHAPSPKVPSSSKQNAGGTNSQSIDTESLLHQSCRLFPKTHAVVESALRMNPDGIRQAVPMAAERGQATKGLGFPVNLAMTHGGSLDVIKMLIEAGPDVLVERDGNDGAGSLGIALANKVDLRIIELLIKANAGCVRMSDRRGNYPLHVAVSNGLPIQLVKRLHTMYPKALQMRNFHSQTPLDIAQRSTLCSEEVMNYLQRTAFLRLESGVHHLDQHNQADLEDGLDDIMQTNF